MRFEKLICATMLVMSCTPAWADWQYTRWGMTPQQVVAASQGKVHLDGGNPDERIEGHEIKAVGTYTSGEYSFRAVFSFVNDRLKDVRLNFPEDGYKLKNALDGLYGKPFHQDVDRFMGIYTYHDAKKNNRIDLVLIGTSNTLEYRPLRDGSAGGL